MSEPLASQRARRAKAAHQLAQSLKPDNAQVPGLPLALRNQGLGQTLALLLAKDKPLAHGLCGWLSVSGLGSMSSKPEDFLAQYLDFSTERARATEAEARLFSELVKMFHRARQVHP